MSRESKSPGSGPGPGASTHNPQLTTPWELGEFWQPRQHPRGEKPFPPGGRERFPRFAELLAPRYCEFRRRGSPASDELAPLRVHVVPGFHGGIESAPGPFHVNSDLRCDPGGGVDEAGHLFAVTHAPAGRLAVRLSCLSSVSGQPDESQRLDQPLRGVPLIPARAVTEVGGELVMEVVLPLAVGHEGHDL